MKKIIIKKTMGQDDKKFSIGFACGVVVVIATIAIRQSWYWDYAFAATAIIITGQVLAVMFKYLALMFYGAWAGNQVLVKMAEKAFEDYCDIAK